MVSPLAFASKSNVSTLPLNFVASVLVTSNFSSATAINAASCVGCSPSPVNPTDSAFHSSHFLLRTSHSWRWLYWISHFPIQSYWLRIPFLPLLPLKQHHWLWLYWISHFPIQSYWLCIPFIPRLPLKQPFLTLALLNSHLSPWPASGQRFLRLYLLSERLPPSGLCWLVGVGSVGGRPLIELLLLIVPASDNKVCLISHYFIYPVEASGNRVNVCRNWVIEL